MSIEPRRRQRQHVAFFTGDRNTFTGYGPRGGLVEFTAEILRVADTRGNVDAEIDVDVTDGQWRPDEYTSLLRSDGYETVGRWNKTERRVRVRKLDS